MILSLWREAWLAAPKHHKPRRPDAQAVRCRPESFSRAGVSGCGFFRRRHGGQIAPGELVAIVLQQLPDSLWPVGAHDEPGVVMLLHAVDNLRSVEAPCIRLGGLCQA